MRTFKTLLLFAAASLAITACKKDKNKKSSTELLTTSAWKIVKFEEKENNGPWVNTFSYIDDCSKDDEWLFNVDMSLDLTEGKTACSGGTPNEVLDTTTWAFLENEAKLKIENDAFTVEQLNESTLVISIVETNGGVTQSTKVTMGH